MAETLEKIVLINNRLLDYFSSGVLSYVIVDTIRKEYANNQTTADDIFIAALVIASYNNSILSLANTIQKNDDSVHIQYLMNSIINSKCSFERGIYEQLKKFIPQLEKALTRISPITEAIIKIRNKTVAHLDKAHINNPSSFFMTPPIKWDEFELAYNVVGSGLVKMKNIIEGGIDFTDFTLLSNWQLMKKTLMVYSLFYRNGSSNVK
jgi:hypothetical protein